MLIGHPLVQAKVTDELSYIIIIIADCVIAAFQ